MKLRPGFLSLAAFVLCLFVSPAVDSSALAQSGRGLPPSQPPPANPTPTPEATLPVSPASPNQPETKQRVVIENADTYTLVFPTFPNVDNFGEQLNKAGVDRYKFASAVYIHTNSPPKHYYSFPVAILKLDEVQHDFAWFKTTSDALVAVQGFADKYRLPSQEGFRVVDLFVTSAFCEEGEPLGMIFGGACEIHHLFLLERLRGVERPVKFILADSPPKPGLKAKMPRELTEQVKEGLAQGYAPIAVFSAWEVLLTEAEHRDELVENPDVQVVTSFDVRGRVNDLAKKGYRLLVINKRGAVMYRAAPTAPPLIYVSLKTKDKRFAEQLAKLQEAGAEYRMTYVGDSGVEDQLMFEQNSVPDGKRREYKVLGLKFQIVEDPALKQTPQNGVRIELTAASQETMKQINKLALEGFVVRDLFLSASASDDVSVLLERSR